jgi:hypothetical protein
MFQSALLISAARAQASKRKTGVGRPKRKAKGKGQTGRPDCDSGGLRRRRRAATPTGHGRSPSNAPKAKLGSPEDRATKSTSSHAFFTTVTRNTHRHTIPGSVSSDTSTHTSRAECATVWTYLQHHHPTTAHSETGHGHSLTGAWHMLHFSPLASIVCTQGRGHRPTHGIPLG